jgi:hypothetical protein
MFAIIGALAVGYMSMSIVPMAANAIMPYAWAPKYVP